MDSFAWLAKMPCFLAQDAACVIAPHHPLGRQRLRAMARCGGSSPLSCWAALSASGLLLFADPGSAKSRRTHSPGLLIDYRDAVAAVQRHTQSCSGLRR